MHWFDGWMWLATNLKGWIYMFSTESHGYVASGELLKLVKVPVIETYGENYIDAINDYGGKIICGMQK